LKLLEANIKYYRKEQGFTQQSLANVLGVSKNSVSNWENGVSTPPLEIIIAMSKVFGLTTDDLLLNTAEDRVIVTTVNESQPSYSPTDYKSKNLFVPVKAQAGYAEGVIDEHTPTQHINVPGVQGEARTFEIAGHSMYPMIQDGDYVVCTPVERTQEIKEGVIYVIVSRDNGLLAKFIRLEERGLRLISANHAEFSPFTVELGDVREIWQARMKISRHFEPQVSPEANPDMVSRLERMEAFLAQQYPDYLTKKG